MPCTTKARSSSFNPPSKRTNGRDVRVPSPVHSRAMKYHGFFGMPLLRQHLVFDKRWTPSSLMTQYQSINELLNRRIIFKAHEATSNRCHYGERSKKLRHQCIEGRSKLLQVNVGDDAHNIHNLLKNHKSMQRLYKRMPNYLIVDNINQRTFVMRKERDRLEFRLKQLKNKYKELLVERAIIRNRINYENAFVMKEELQSRILLKKIENSDVRLKAVRTINNTYQKIKQVLLHDEIFYEPILSSLDADIEDQANFINHIIYLGKPAISKFKLLDQKYRKLERDVRENILDKIRMLDSFKKARPPPNKKEELPLSANFRYVRETETMARLKYQLKTVEKVIKEVKLTALCSQAREIYERMRGQAKENENLHLSVKYDVMHHETLEMKHKFSTVLKGVLIDNLSEEEINRMERIKDLTNILRKDEQYELDTLEYS
ncbi:uncharacterized protein LOC108602059 isoform X2 [Drosophila busckii]|uniref:uncharacterized protein LOC108602059 isoform X2 n=1 Tax=Drosophila busckii TaxID=30019 RepID=UPI00083EB259|nr:uncharacterized protein LOC108602059 isoform X2 [Drosophila busckii]